LYSPNIISIIKREMRWVINSMHGKDVEYNPEWKTPFERARQRWELGT
jgi:hypothetical protein